MDDIILKYAKHDQWDHAQFCKDFQNLRGLSRGGMVFNVLAEVTPSAAEGIITLVRRAPRHRDRPALATHNQLRALLPRQYGPGHAGDEQTGWPAHGPGHSSRPADNGTARAHPPPSCEAPANAATRRAPRARANGKSPNGCGWMTGWRRGLTALILTRQRPLRRAR